MRWLIVLAACIASIVAGCWWEADRFVIDSSVNRAREVVLASDLQLTAEEIAVIREKYPSWGIHRLGREHGEYYFRWTIGDQEIIVSGEGNLYRLDGAKVLKEPLRRR